MKQGLAVAGGQDEIRMLIVGGGLLAGALASAFSAYGFATKNVVAEKAEVHRGIEWRPNLVLMDVRSLDVGSGLDLLGELRRAGLRACVIDASDDDDRLDAWKDAGTSTLIDGREPFDRLLRMINPPASSRCNGSFPASAFVTYTSKQGQGPVLGCFDDLTEREQSVLAELMEGHCAEEIAKAAFVSISTVRSQIKAILQKLGVNSQLAAVALTRRAGWSSKNSVAGRGERASARRVQPTRRPL